MIKKQFYFLLVYVATSRLVESHAHRYPYQLIKAVATVHHEMISNPEEKEDYLPFLDVILPPSTTALERTCLEKLIKIHAKARDVRPISPSRISTIVENQFRKWHQQGMTEKELKAHWKKETMKEVREEVTAQYATMLLCYDFVNDILLDSTPTPAQIDDFYHVYIVPQSFEVPPKVVLLQIVCYPTDNTENLNDIIEVLNELYYTLSALSDTKQKKAALLQAVQNYYRRKNFTVRYSYLPNRHGAPGLTSEEIPRDLQEVMYAKGIAELVEGQLIAPHTFLSKNGQKGVRMIFVAQLLPAHHINRLDDYAYINLVYQQTKRNANFMQWWELRKKETEVYE